MIYRGFVKLYYGYFHGDLCRYGNERNIQGPVLLFSFKHGGGGENVIFFFHCIQICMVDKQVNVYGYFLEFIMLLLIIGE